MSETQTNPINVAFPEAGTLHLKIKVGACRLKIRPGGQEPWITGTYYDPTGSLPSRVTQHGGEVTITQERFWPDIASRLTGLPAVFDLALGTGKPYAITVETGASEAIIDLGGVPVTSMGIRHGAGKMLIDFSAPNPVEMSTMAFSGGASGVEMTNLANANCAEMKIEGGAAGYVFDFGGTLRREGRVQIRAAMASVDVRVPSSTAVRVASESIMGGVDVGDGFMKKEGMFWNEAALTGRGPQLTIRASVTMGSLRLRT